MSVLNIYITSKDVYYVFGLSYLVTLILAKENITPFFVLSDDHGGGVVSDIVLGEHVASVNFPDGMNKHLVFDHTANSLVEYRYANSDKPRKLWSVPYSWNRLCLAEAIDKLRRILRLAVYTGTMSAETALDTFDLKDVVLLTLRERQVLHYTAKGYNNKTIAKILNNSMGTVSGHKRRAMKKLDLRTNVDFYRYADYIYSL